MGLVAERRLVPLVSTALFLEYEDVFHRPQQREVHGLDSKAVARVLKELAALCEAVEPHFSWRPQLSDPSDEIVLEVELNGRADWSGAQRSYYRKPGSGFLGVIPGGIAAALGGALFGLWFDRHA